MDLWRVIACLDSDTTTLDAPSHCPQAVENLQAQLLHACSEAAHNAEVLQQKVRMLRFGGGGGRGQGMGSGGAGWAGLGAV